MASIKSILRNGMTNHGLETNEVQQAPQTYQITTKLSSRYDHQEAHGTVPTHNSVLPLSPESLGGSDQVQDHYVVLTKERTSQGTSHNEQSQLANIETVPSLVLTVFYHGQPVHITLDGGATSNYVRKDICDRHGFKIRPNSQTSLLGDKKTRIESLGEIDETFTRDNWHVRLRAIVVRNLGADIFGGTVFQDENDIALRQKKKEITVKGKHKIYSTDLNMPLPQTIQPSLQSANAVSNVLTINNNGVILPGQSITIPVHPTDFCDGDIVATEPRNENKNKEWPPPQLCTIKDSEIQLKNNTTEPILMGSEVHVIGLTRTDPVQDIDSEHVLNNMTHHQTRDIPGPCSSNGSHIKLIQVDENKLSKPNSQAIQKIHNTYKAVFDPDLQEGYNGAAGSHYVKLHWADSSRPPANKMYAPRWSTNRDVILQRKIDQLTNDGVLLIPQEVDVQVKFISNVFLQKKGRASHKDLAECENDELRFLCDFTQLNSYIHPTPSKVSTPQEIWSFVAENPYIIVADMYNSYFQMHMDKRDYPYLGIMSPYKGLRIMSRSGQGLLNSDTELKELVAKVLGEEIAQNKCKVVADDLVIGGVTIDMALDNYACVLAKLDAANIKLTPEKTRIFPDQVTLHGWLLKDGLIEPDPHRQLSLTKVKHEEMKTSSHLRSWIGLLKTFLPAMSANCHLLDCLETAVAGKQPKTNITWSEEMKENFQKIKDSAKENIKQLALPARNEQLFLLPDAAVKFPGIGFVLMVKRNNQFLPVHFMGFKLKQYHRLWYPCEQEALGVAVAVEKSAYYITQSNNRTIVGVDSKPVLEAFMLMKAGKFSSSSRMQSFLHCINRFPITVQHISGKFRANMSGDYISRNPPTCPEPEKCQLCLFVQEKSQSILCSTQPEDTNKLRKKQPTYDVVAFMSYGLPAILATLTLNDLIQGTAEIPFGNRSAWRQLQQDDPSCAKAIQHIRSGQPLPKKGQQYNDARNYFTNASLSKPDNLLVVRDNVQHQSTPRERIVIPKKFVSAVVDQLHHSLSCPSEYQLNKILDRYFYGINIRKKVQQTKMNCYSCKARTKIPDELIEYNPVSDPLHPGVLFNADVIQRTAQNILVARDLFSCLTAATLIPSQKAHDIKEGLVNILQPVRHPGPITVRMDNAPGNQTLVKTKDPELDSLNIHIELGDKINKNAIASVDRAQQEIENELKKICPEAETISTIILARAVQTVNTKIRGQGLSAFEIHTSREQITGENLQLRDQNIAKRHRQIKKENNEYASTRQGKTQPQTDHHIIVGDMAYLKKDPNDTKHTIRHMYMVTKKGPTEGKFYIQKILHSHTDKQTKLSSERLLVRAEQLYPAFDVIQGQPWHDDQGQHDHNQQEQSVYKQEQHRHSQWEQHVHSQRQHIPEWDPIRYEDSSDDEDQLITVTPANQHYQPNNDADGAGEIQDDIQPNDVGSDAADEPLQTPPNEDQDDEEQHQHEVQDQQQVDDLLQVLDRLHEQNPGEQSPPHARPVPQRAAAAQAVAGIQRGVKGIQKVIPQIDGAYVTPSTSADTTPHDNQSWEDGHEEGNNQLQQITDDFQLQQTTEEGQDDSSSSMDWDHHQSTSDLSPDTHNEAFSLPQLDIRYDMLAPLEIGRVFNFDDVLPIKSSHKQPRKSSSSSSRSRKKEKKRKLFRCIPKVWKRGHRKRKDKDDEPPDANHINIR